MKSVRLILSAQRVTFRAWKTSIRGDGRVVGAQYHRAHTDPARYAGELAAEARALGVDVRVEVAPEYVCVHRACGAPVYALGARRYYCEQGVCRACDASVTLADCSVERADTLLGVAEGLS